MNFHQAPKGQAAERLPRHAANLSGKKDPVSDSLSKVNSFSTVLLCEALKADTDGASRKYVVRQW
jgi:hypothetical protein